MLAVVAATAAAAVAYPGGWSGSCNPAGPTVEDYFPRELHPVAPVLACSKLFCNLTSAEAFRGFVIGSSTGKNILPDPSDAWAYHPHCVTHRNRLEKTAVSFELRSDAVVHAVVVYSKSGAAHSYATAASVLASAQPKRVVIVGAGPGGVAAARYAAGLGHTAVVYERGPVADGLFAMPAAASYLDALTKDNHSLLFNPLDSSDNSSHLLGSMVGGTQNINGAVAAPGRAADLARSTGVSVTAAAAAQAVANDYVDTVPAIAPDGHNVNLMLHCAGPEGGCDPSYVASASTMHRRSVATGFTDVHNLELHPDTEVKHVAGDGTVTLANGTTAAPGDFVVLAAGALASPRLLNETLDTFEGYNHYYTHETVDAPPGGPNSATQVFEYVGDTEVNYAKVPNGTGPPFWIKITMLMTPTVRETHRVGRGHELPQSIRDLRYPAQAWHFMGTVPHTAMLVDGAENVYIGDASALQTPFNCHTSMPAAAAGVLAVQAGLATLPDILPPPDRAAALGGKSFATYTALFVGGTMSAAAGVLVHATEGPGVAWLHYVLMPLAAALIIAGAFTASTHDRGAAAVSGTGPLMTGKYRYHKTLGRATVLAVILQTIAGMGIRAWRGPPGREVPWQVGAAHRACGFVTLVLLATMAGSGVSRNSPARMFERFETVEAAGIVAAAVAAVAAAAALPGIYARGAQSSSQKQLRASLL